MLNISTTLTLSNDQLSLGLNPIEGLWNDVKNSEEKKLKFNIMKEA